MCARGTAFVKRWFRQKARRVKMAQPIEQLTTKSDDDPSSLDLVSQALVGVQILFP